ncbi:MAG: endonuclease/exonuclease/phosphatase family protein [Verrucomicrobia bacterium]|nr:endonuclease/exonuclease/phosphatase family protein [Verrucomicrobiota bacterium]
MKNRFFEPRLRLSGLFGAAVFVAGVGTVLGFLGRFYWLFDLASHFRVQYCALFMVLLLTLCVARKWRLALFALAMLLINVLCVAPLFFNGSSEPEGTHTVYRAMLINVNTQFGDSNSVRREILRAEPDLLVLEEINEEWMAELKDVLTDFPHRKIRLRDDNFGIGLFGRHMWKDADVLYGGGVLLPSICATYGDESESFVLITTHPVPPGSRRMSEYRNKQLAWLADLVRHFKEPVIVLGDLNVSPFSHYFHKLLKDGRLEDSAEGRGYKPTWPSFMWPLLIPIDHCLHTKGISIHRHEIGNQVGSDHYPVIIDFSVDRVRVD